MYCSLGAVLNEGGNLPSPPTTVKKKIDIFPFFFGEK
jgi:hypothetical protein